MIIQGSNEPLVIQFDESVDALDKLLVTLWADKPSRRLIRQWRETEMQIAQDTVTCPLTEQETAALPTGPLTVEIKGLDGSGTVVLYEAISIPVAFRRDGGITLTEDA